MSWHVGDRWEDTFEIVEPIGKEYVDPDVVNVTITKPDASTYVGTVVRDSQGHYHLNENLTEAGKWRAGVTTTGRYQASKPKSITVHPL
jgi:hypothetical protein